MPEDEAIVAALQNEVEGWRRLAWHLLNQGPLFHVANAEPRIGTLPDRLPFNLPLPPDSRIIGSVADETKVTIFLDSSRSPAEVWQFYRAKMLAPEWAAFGHDVPMPSGFVPAMPSAAFRFCQGPSGPSLTVQVRQGDAVTEVMLLVVNDPHGSLCPPEPEYSRLRDAPQPDHASPEPRLPPVLPPGKGRMYPTSSRYGIRSDGYRSEISQAHLTTELDLGVITDYVKGQLEKAGWTYRAGGHAGPTAFSEWTVQPRDGETLAGTLILVRTHQGTPNSYFLYLQVGAPDEPLEFNPSLTVQAHRAHFYDRGEAAMDDSDSEPADEEPALIPPFLEARFVSAQEWGPEYTESVRIRLTKHDLELLERFAQQDDVPTDVLGRSVLQRAINARRGTITEITYRFTTESLLAIVPQDELADIDVPGSTRRYSRQVSRALHQRYPDIRNSSIRCEDKAAEAIPPWTVKGEGGHELADTSDIITYQLEPLVRDIAQSGDWIVHTGQSGTKPRRRDSSWTVRLLIETDAGRQDCTSTVQAPDKTVAERRAFEALNSSPDLLRGRNVKSVRTLYAIHQDERCGAMHSARAFPRASP